MLFQLLAFVVLVAVSHASTEIPEVKPTNLLFIMFDDLRPELSIYGREHMITPNFERLAAKSVVFDYSFCQVAVCNPSRDSLMTGLRPDSVGTYNFGHSYWPHLTMPTQLVRSGYNTAGIGKLFHWETTDKNTWSFDSWDNKWYDYQGYEGSIMNSSTMPDKTRKEEEFRDYLFVERAIKTWKQMLKDPKPFMLALGFKLPHLALHVPYKYYDMYKGKTDYWKLSKKELRFPTTTPEVSYRCCAEGRFQFMREEGALPHNRTVDLMDINMVLPDDMHDELMMGYCAGVTFTDKLLGMLLDVMDERNLWENTTVILSADHGMHNGEKGIWEKWTLFEEATRVPLIISHPLSPYKGQHYKYPTESIDIYATVNELLKLPVPREQTCTGFKCKTLQGKSLAPVVLGNEIYQKSFGNGASSGVLGTLKSMINRAQKVLVPGVVASNDSSAMPVLEHNFALSQAIRCVPTDKIPPKRAVVKGSSKSETHKVLRSGDWGDCDPVKPNSKELSVLGYAMRTPEYRYVAYFHYDRSTQLPNLEIPPYEEELYDHKNETLRDFTHRETFNLAVKPSYAHTIQNLRAKLVHFIKYKIPFGDH